MMNDKGTQKLKRQKEQFVEIMTQCTKELVPHYADLAYHLMEVGLDDPKRLAITCAHFGIPVRRQENDIEFSLEFPSMNFRIEDAKPKGVRADSKKSGRASTKRTRPVKH